MQYRPGAVRSGGVLSEACRLQAACHHVLLRLQDALTPAPTRLQAQVLFTAGLAEALLEEMAFWVKEHAGPVPPMWANGASGSPLSAAAAAAGKGTAE